MYLTQKIPKRGTHRLCWERTPPPASPFEQSFEVLPTCSHQRLTVDLPEPSQRQDMRIHQEPFRFFIFPQRKPEAWRSKESAVSRPAQENATRARHARAASSPAPPPASGSVTGRRRVRSRNACSPQSFDLHSRVASARCVNRQAYRTCFRVGAVFAG